MTHTRLSLLSCAIVFYYYYHKLVLWYLDQVPSVPNLTEPFEEIIEIDTSRIPKYTVTHPDDEWEIIDFPYLIRQDPIIGVPIPFPMGGATIVISCSGHLKSDINHQDPLLYHPMASRETP